MTLDASGTLRDSDIAGAHLPELQYEAHLDAGALDARAKGRFEHLDPGRVAGNPRLNGAVTGTADVHAQIADIQAPITPQTIVADGTVALESSTIGDLQIDSAAVEGRFADQVGNLTRLTLASPDVKVDASGHGRARRRRRVGPEVPRRGDRRWPRWPGSRGRKGSRGRPCSTVRSPATGRAGDDRNDERQSGLGYQENKRARREQQYTVTVPDLEFAKAHVKATTAATFVKVGSVELNDVTATTTYQDMKLDFAASLTQQDREVEASGRRRLPSRSPGNPPAIAGPAHAGCRVADRARQRRGRPLRRRPGRAAGRQAGERRSVARGRPAHSP